MRYCIIKKIKIDNDKREINSIILDELGEVLEFDDHKKANDMKKLFENNSDSGHIYLVKKI